MLRFRAKWVTAGLLVPVAVGASACWLASLHAAAADSLDLTEQVIRVGKGPGAIAIADVNHDEKLDLIVANEEDATISVLLGDGSGHFTPAPGSPFASNANPNDIAIADMNGDGNPDLVIANTQTPYLTILLGDGRGGFRPAPHSPFATQSRPHPHGVAVGDFLGNGTPAVITDSWGDGKILLLPGDGKGNLILPGTFFDTGSRYTDQGVRAGRFTESGHLDIVTSGHNSNAIGLMLGDGRGGFHNAPGSPFLAGGNAFNFAVDDVNRDGHLDVLAIPYERDLQDRGKFGVTVLLGNGKGAFSIMPGLPLSLEGCRGPGRVAAGNLRGNKFHDIVVSCAQNDKLFFFLARDDGSFEKVTRDIATGWGGLALADLERRGKDDLVVSNHDSGTITILRAK